jgi:hypothetical protein
VGVAAPLLLLAAAGVARAATAAPPPPPAALEESRGAVSIDWAEGTLIARAGAAADLRMPSADLARPGSERRARAAAVARLKEALGALPLGGGRTLPADAVERALGRAELVDVEYQSNGGAVVRMRARFGDWLPAPAPTGPTLALGEARLAAAPALRVGGQEVASGAARYRIGAPPSGTHAIPVKIDREGRWNARAEKVNKGDKGERPDKDLADRLAGAAIVIYVQKVVR